MVTLQELTKTVKGLWIEDEPKKLALLTEWTDVELKEGKILFRLPLSDCFEWLVDHGYITTTPGKPWHYIGNLNGISYYRTYIQDIPGDPPSVHDFRQPGTLFEVYIQLKNQPPIIINLVCPDSWADSGIPNVQS